MRHEKIAYWKSNLFKLPSGAAGKNYIRETTRLMKEWSSKSILKDIAWKSIMIMPSLLLQKSSHQNKAKNDSVHLNRRLLIWAKGDILELLKEGETIQSRLLVPTRSVKSIENISKQFATLMKNGNVTAAVNLITDNMKNGILPLSDETMTLLQEKHPEGAELDRTTITSTINPEAHPIVYEEITPDTIKTAALNTKGGAGPSGMNADGWRHILASKKFGSSAEDLRQAFTEVIKQLCTENVEIETDINGKTTSSIEALLACRLVPLDKSPGLHPIGVGEVLRRIAGKVVMRLAKNEIQTSVGSLQVCAGQSGGCEAAIHAMKDIYDEESNDAVLLIDAANAFNAINRKSMLQNITRICPIVSTYAHNCYSTHARLFVLGGKELSSTEGTTQGDPTAMAYYAIGSLPFCWMINSNTTNPIKQVAYADDLTGAGNVANLRSWFQRITEIGPKFGYNAEPTKSWLIVKEEKFDEAERVFAGTGVNITTDGKKHLGAAIGSDNFRTVFISDLVEKWVSQIDQLAQIATHEPHAAYTAYTSCIRHKYNFYLRTIPNIADQLQPLENAIRSKLIPALTEGQLVTDDERSLLSLPVRLGGMGLISPPVMSDEEYQFSKDACDDLIDAIKNQQKELPTNYNNSSGAKKSEIRTKRRTRQAEVLEDLKSRMTQMKLDANEMACEAGSYNWLTVLPIKEKGYFLNKREFWDAIRLRYGWPLKRLPSKCACQETFSVAHALTCKKGGFIISRHNEIRDITAELLDEVCNDVKIEPPLEQLTGETMSLRLANTSDEARLDISARGYWTPHQRAFFDIRVFNPLAPRYTGQPLSRAYKINENDKKREYNERVLQLENGTFTPLIFSATGGMGNECRKFYKKLSEEIAEKRDENLSVVSSYIRTRISFALLRSALVCIRGSRSRYITRDIAEIDMRVANTESEIRD